MVQHIVFGSLLPIRPAQPNTTVPRARLSLRTQAPQVPSGGSVAESNKESTESVTAKASDENQENQQ